MEKIKKNREGARKASGEVESGRSKLPPYMGVNKAYRRKYIADMLNGSRPITPTIEKWLDDWVERTARELEKLDQDMYSKVDNEICW